MNEPLNILEMRASFDEALDRWKTVFNEYGLCEWAEEEVPKLFDEICQLRSVLESVEWIDMSEDCIYPEPSILYQCPWCDWWEVDGHAPDCVRQVALYGKSWEKKK